MGFSNKILLNRSSEPFKQNIVQPSRLKLMKSTYYMIIAENGGLSRLIELEISLSDFPFNFTSQRTTFEPETYPLNIINLINSL